MVIAVLPYVGGAVYFLFGEIDLGNQANRRHSEIFSELRTNAPKSFCAKSTATSLIHAPYRQAFEYATSINGFHAVSGNRARVMADAEATRMGLVADIDASKHYVHVLYYIWLDDRTGTEVAHALMRAAKRGVTCRALADGMGSRALIESPLWREVGEAGVELAVALPLDRPLKTLLKSRFDLRNHRKITVIDGQVTYCGSRNSADPEFLVKAKYAPWVDIMLRFTGPVVAQNDLLFLSDWMAATGQPFDAFTLRQPSVQNGFPAQVFGDGPTERRGATPQLFATLFASAEREITLSTPYFVPDTTALEALCAAAHRGVQVQLIFPRVNDSWIVAAASRSFYGRLLSAGCKIHEFNGGLLHAKTLTIDGVVSLIGSSNLDLRSFDLNYENNILLCDQETTASICARQNAYLSQSDPVHLDEVKRWPPHRRIWNNAIATIGPVL